MNPIELGRNVLHRLRVDYLTASRIGEYESFLKHARREGYQLIPLIELYDLAQAGSWSDAFKCVALRHDVDIGNAEGNRRFFEVERDCEARATYYFRQSTAPVHEALISDLVGAGFEVGYHHEEGAAVAKKHRLRRREEVFERKGEVQDRFRENWQVFRARYGETLRSVCSYDDWINQHLGFANHELLDDAVLDECGIAFEACDEAFVAHGDAFVSDATPTPERWRDGVSPMDALSSGKKRIYLLTHERAWYPGRRASTAANLNRFVDELSYRLRR